MKSSRMFLALGFTALTLSACSNMTESLGLGRTPPDEFAVVDRPPLSMPPDFGLRPPRPGAPRPQEVDVSKHASETLFGGPAPAPIETAKLSDGERALLENTGAVKADPAIRDTVDREASNKVVGSPHLVDELLWWKPTEQPGAVVNAPAEAARIKEAKDKGAAVNQGATPIIEHLKSGWLGL